MAKKTITREVESRFILCSESGKGIFAHRKRVEKRREKTKCSKMRCFVGAKKKLTSVIQNDIIT